MRLWCWGWGHRRGGGVLAGAAGRRRGAEVGAVPVDEPLHQQLHRFGITLFVTLFVTKREDCFAILLETKETRPGL